MSSSPGRREVAHRLFAAEFDDADFSYSESDEERAPNYVVTPTGARVNRLFLVGVLTEVERVNEEMLRARVVDPTGAFVVYAGQYQPDELAFLERAEPPTFLAVTGKARTFEPDDGDRVFTSVRPESINEVDAETRDRWAINAAERTLERIGTMASAIDSGLTGEDLRAALADADVDESFAAGVPLALDHYGTTPDYLAALREVARDVVRLVADETDEVRSLDLAPGDGAGDASSLADRGLELTATDRESTTEPAATTTERTSEPESSAASDAETGTDTGVDDAEPIGAEGTERESTEPDGEPEAEPAATAEATGTVDDGEASSDEGTEEIGEFEPGEFDTEESESLEEPPDDVLDEAEREEIEAEFGTDFSTASEVEAPGETAGGPTSESEAAESEPDTSAESEPEPASESDREPEPDAPETAAEPDDAAADDDTPAEPADEADTSADDEQADVSVEDAVMEEMDALDDGDGADRETLVDRVTERTGANPDEVEDAVQDLLMSGQCYEPDDGLLKPI